MLNVSIIGASGSAIDDGAWSLETNPHVTLDISSEGRTRVESALTRSTYLVAGGSPSDFKVLSEGHGVRMGHSRVLHVRSNATHTGSAVATLALLEYDSSRRRLGEADVRLNQLARVTLRAGTEFVLVSIRIVGQGSVTFNDLVVDLTGEPARRRGTHVEYLKRPTNIDEAAPTLLQVRAATSDLLRQARVVEQQLAEYAAAPGATTAGPPTEEVTGRDAGPIGNARERMIRRLLIEMANSLPRTNGSHHYSPIEAAIGIITDEYMFNSYKDAFREVHYLSPDTIEQTLAQHNLDAIVYVTCWKGMHDEEWKGVKFREKPMQALATALDHARDRGIPTVFQSIEDPSNYEYFLPIAQQFTYVFTSDTDLLQAYERDLGHDRVHYGEYGANPLVNNPVGSFRYDLPQAFFAGSYSERYPERCTDMRTIFDSVPDRDDQLVIIDRNFESDAYEFPDEYQNSIIGPVPHAVLQRIHKLFRFSLNFNSIKTSPTMCAMRVYELAAQGKPLLSDYARSVFNRFPEVRIVAEPTQLRAIAAGSLSHDEAAMAQRALHRVMHDRSSFEVVGRLAGIVGLPGVSQRSPRVLVVAEGDFDEVAAMVARQQLVEVEVRGADELAEGRINAADYGYLAAMRSGTQYGPYYLVSRINAFKYADVLFATQRARFHRDRYDAGLVHEFVGSADDPFVTVVSTAHPDARDFVLGLREQISGTGYAVDPYEVDYQPFLHAELEAHMPAGEPYLTVIVPVHNNGRFLETKCLTSLRRNALWPRMEVLLIDDGSTDDDTVWICRRLAETYPNVSLIEFGDGGSGSASRPRNRGIEVARGQLIAFLDPDNEISEGGYDVLVAEYERMTRAGTPVDFVSGYQVKVSRRVTLTGRHAKGRANLVDNPRDAYFAAGRFPVVSTQAAVFPRNFLVDGGIRYVERATGQDTLFGWELLAKAERVLFTDEAHLIYYAEREDSVTNRVDLHYFEKCRVMEEAQVPKLAELGLLDLYKKHHLDSFVKKWYVPQLQRMVEDRRGEAITILSHIVNLYGREISEFSLTMETSGI